MRRIKGFVRKIGRPTKGGSLPGSRGARDFGRSFLRYFSGQRLSDENGAISRNNGYSQLLEKVIVDLVSSRGTAHQSSLAAATDPTTYVRAEPADTAPVWIPRWKRILDVTCILLTLPCWLPLTILIMAWIRWASPGPVFYRQERIGYRRNRFMIFKFRTMHMNAETRTHEEYFAHLMRVDLPMTKLDAAGDSRLIACGRFLRASGLDELPQIFNVLRGEMSLVGPRPCLPNEFQRYEAWQQQRVNAPPGLTGYWQVNGKNKTTFREMIAMDIFYSRNMSVWLDLTIILKTVPALIGQILDSRKRMRRMRRMRGHSPQQITHQRSTITESLNGAEKI